jgi:hypothetical protein
MSRGPSVESLKERRLEVLDALFNDDSIVITGSIGRAVILGQELPPPLRGCGHVRDIDAFNTQGVPTPDQTINSIHVDYYFNNWLLRGDNGDFYVRYPEDGDEHPTAVPAHLLEPQERATDEGVRVRTFSPEAQLFIERILGPLRHEDKKEVRALADLYEEGYEKLFSEIMDEYEGRLTANHPFYRIYHLLYNNTVGYVPKRHRQRVGLHVNKFAQALGAGQK